MSEEILINATPSETRVALVEGGMLQEVWLERTGRTGLIGSIYKGVVSRVLPGLQAAFVDIGLERTAFLHALDMTRGDQPPAGIGLYDCRIDMDSLGANKAGLVAIKNAAGEDFLE